MLRSVDAFTGYQLAATDDVIGKVKDFLFEQDTWVVRWMVADTGRWLPKRKVLVSPVSIGQPDWDSHLFPVKLTKEQIEQAPSLDEDAPVSRQHERSIFDWYGYPYYWGGAGFWGGAFYPGALYLPGRKPEQPTVDEGEPDALRSVEEIAGYHIEASDGAIGHVEDTILDDESWVLRYLVVDTRNWLPGRKVIVSPDWVTSITWHDKSVHVDLERDAVEHSPEFDPSVPVNREYEVELYDYYGRPVYWR